MQYPRTLIQTLQPVIQLLILYYVQYVHCYTRMLVGRVSPYGTPLQHYRSYYVYCVVKQLSILMSSCLRPPVENVSVA